MFSLSLSQAEQQASSSLNLKSILNPGPDAIVSSFSPRVVPYRETKLAYPTPGIQIVNQSMSIKSFKMFSHNKILLFFLL